ncbi:MAG: thiol:disulfide interchange protein DsbG [Stellaceae bacterium]
MARSSISWCRFEGIFLAFLIAAGGAVATTAASPSARSASAPATQRIQVLLRHALHRFGPMRVLRTEPGPPGVTAALVSIGGRKAIIWIIGDGRAVAIGNVWDAKGHNLTRKMAITMGVMPHPIAPAAVAAAAAVPRHMAFVIGSKGPEVTVFLDPNCIFCHEWYEQALPLLAAGRLRLRVVMVGFLKPTSASRAAAILMAKDPARALHHDEQDFNVTAEEGGIAPAVHIPPAIRKAVAANTRLLSESGVEATPTLLFRDHAGGWHVMHQVPSGGLAAWLAHRKG